MSSNKHLADLMKVCSILPIFAVLPAMAEVPQPVDGKLTNQTVANETGRIYDFSVLGTDLEISGSNFVNNSNNGWGSITNLTAGHNLTIKDSVFTGNFSGIAGGAVSSGTGADTLTVDGVTFTKNHAREDGGAIASYRGLKITDSVFDGNTAQLDKDSNGEYTKNVMGADPVGGGALALGAVSETQIAAITSTTFKNNVSGLNGGAIGTRLAKGITSDWTLADSLQDNKAKLDIAATFEDNYAKRSGGAIYNTFWNNNELGKGDGVTVTGTFEDNEAGYRGGAIYNDGDHDKNGKGGVMTINDATFTDNEAGNNGGAIYNTGTLVINGGLFEENEAGQWAGAIYNTGRTDNKDLNMATTKERETAGDLTVKNAQFLNNHAVYGGALVAGLTAKNTYIENTIFKGNTASELGAVALFSSATLNNVQFIDNKATTTTEAIDVDGAGALFLGSDSSTDVRGVLENSKFDSNSSGINGGAIATRTFVQGDNRRAKLDISNTMFNGNIAGTVGGAFDNYFYHSNTNADAVYVKGSEFVGNIAVSGGAVYNHGLASKQLSDKESTKNNTLKQAAAIEFVDTTFTGNKASVAGGAIFNEAGATVILSGNNVFSGNTAKGGRNDIYNMGMLNIVSGTTTMDGGINGKDGKLTLAEGATLDIGTTSIVQSSIDINGAVKAAVLSDKSFGRFVGDVTIGDSATLNLTVGSVGTYDIFDGASIDLSKINVGGTYDVSESADGIVISTKSVENLAADTGLSTQAAGAVAGLANSTNRTVQQISLLIQDALNSDEAEKIAMVEKEVAKLNPDDKPVAQAVSVSVQNQLATITAGRMSGVTSVGRAGGDAAKESGFWMQGLFNKSKYADQFHGYTRGFALGGDVVLNRVFTLGAGFSYGNTDVHASNSRDTAVESNTLFMYGQYKPNRWYANATLMYTMSDYTEETDILGMPLTNDYDVDTYGAHVMTGYDFASGISAEIGARYMHVEQDAYSNGVSSVNALDTDFLSGVAGLKYAFTIESDWALKLRPELKAAATYDFISDDSMATVVMPGAAPYQVGGDRLSRLGGEFGIGLTALYKGMEISVMYDLDLHEDYTSQTGMLKFRGQF